MIQLSILPQEHKDRLRAQLRQQIIMRYLLLAGMALCLAIAYAWAIGTLINQNLDRVNQEIFAIEQSASRVPLSTVGETVDEQYALLHNFHENRSIRLERLVQLLDATPTGIHLSSFEYNPANHRIAIIGSSDDRNAIQLFRQQLESLSFVSDIRIPTTSLAEPRETPFTLDATIDGAP